MAKRKTALEQKIDMFLVNDELGRENLRLKARIRELEAELAVRDNMGDEVLRILREATGKRDFHSEMEAAEYAAKLLAEARRDGARLDWLESHNIIPMPIESEMMRAVGGYRVKGERFNSLRAAIDAAMKEAK